MHPWELDEYDMTEFVIKLDGSREQYKEKWEELKFLAYYSIRGHLDKDATYDKVFPKKAISAPLSANELRKRTLEAARLSRNSNGNTRRRNRKPK